MKIISLFLLMALAFGNNSIYGQDDSFTMSLDQALEYAVQHNKTLQNARGQVASSIEGVRAARSQGLPQVNGSIDFMTYFNYEMEFSFGGSDEGTEPPDYSKFDDGDLEILRMLSGMFESEPIIMDNQMSGAVQFSQLIFSGQYWSGLEIAKIAKFLANQNVTKTEQDVKEGVINTYYLILVTEKNLKIIQDNIKNLNETLQHTDNMFKTGIAEATDVDQLRIAVSQLLNAQKSVERAIQMSYNMLRFQLGAADRKSVV